MATKSGKSTSSAKRSSSESSMFSSAEKARIKKSAQAEMKRKGFKNADEYARYADARRGY